MVRHSRVFSLLHQLVNMRWNNVHLCDIIKSFEGGKGLHTTVIWMSSEIPWFSCRNLPFSIFMLNWPIFHPLQVLSHNRVSVDLRVTLLWRLLSIWACKWSNMTTIQSNLLKVSPLQASGSMECNFFLLHMLLSIWFQESPPHSEASMSLCKHFGRVRVWMIFECLHFLNFNVLPVVTDLHWSASMIIILIMPLNPSFMDQFSIL